jgi:hypothetical protein
MSGSKTIATSETKLEAMRFQSSAYGGTLPVVFGVTRIPGNLLWYGGFRAIPNTTTEAAGGKGGAVKTQNTTYTYEAAVMMALCEGEVTGISRIWRGKTLYSGGVTASQIITATATYAVPSGGGSFTVTPPSSGVFSASINVECPVGGGEGGFTPFIMSEGSDYGRVGNTYTFGGTFPIISEGQTVTITYQYTVAGASQTSLQQMGMSLANGAVGQAVWSYLTTNYSSQAIGYSGIAHVRSSAYDLGSSAAVENHNFEVQATMAYHLGASVPDVVLATVGYTLLTNDRFGAGFDASRLGSVTNWSDYCRAANLLGSPAFTEQAPMAEVLSKLCKITNTAPVVSEGTLKFIPFGDATITGNGATYTANTTPIYDLDDRFFLDKENPVKLMRKPQADAHNHVRIEFLNRANQYNIEIAEAKDQADIDTYGIRSAEVFQAHWICDAAVARDVAQLFLQRSLYIRSTYKFKLPVHFNLLEPMDLVTLTDARLGLSLTPVRLTHVDEPEDGEIHCTAETFPIGSASSTLYPTEVGAGFAHDYNVAPGSVDTPMFFEGPRELSSTGLEVYAAVRGAVAATWGGCTAWASTDGSNYKQIGRIYGPARYGTLFAAVTATVGDGLGMSIAQGQMISGSAADAAALSTLMYVGGTNPEYCAHTTATLIGAGQYNLTSASRGAYGTVAAAHSIGDQIARVDQSIVKSGPLDLTTIGKTLYFKFTSFNVYGGAEQLLSDVSAYTYVVTGAMFKFPLSGGTFTIVPEGVVIDQEKNTITKVTGGNAWNAEARSLESHTSGAYVSFQANQTSYDVMVGLNDDPEAGDAGDITNLNFAWYVRGDVLADIRLNGTQVAGPWAYTVNSVFVAAYDNTAVRFYQDGVLRHTEATSANLKLFSDSAFFSQGAAIRNLKFGPVGSKGDDGVAGVDGDDGVSPAAMTLSADGFVLPADSTGVVSTYSGATTTAKVWLGTTEDTSNWSFGKTDSSGVTSSFASNVLTVTNMTSGTDTGYVDITATRSGYPTQTKRFNLTKAKAATPASAPVTSPGNLIANEATIAPTQCQAGIRFNTDGTISRRGGTGSYTTLGSKWYNPTTSGIGSSYWIMFTRVDSGSAGLDSGTLNSWLALTANREIAFTNSTGVEEGSFNFTIASDSSGNNVVSSGSIYLRAEQAI